MRRGYSEHLPYGQIAVSRSQKMEAEQDGFDILAYVCGEADVQVVQSDGTAILSELDEGSTLFDQVLSENSSGQKSSDSPGSSDKQAESPPNTHNRPCKGNGMIGMSSW